MGAVSFRLDCHELDINYYSLRNWAVLYVFMIHTDLQERDISSRIFQGNCSYISTLYSPLVNKGSEMYVRKSI